MLARMRRKWKHSALLVEIQNGAPTVKPAWCPLRIKNRIAIRSSHFTFGYIPPKNLKQGNKEILDTRVYSSIVYTSQVSIDGGAWINKMECTYNEKKFWNGWNLKTLCKWNKLITKEHMPYDSTQMTYSY